MRRAGDLSALPQSSRSDPAHSWTGHLPCLWTVVDEGPLPGVLVGSARARLPPIGGIVHSQGFPHLLNHRHPFICLFFKSSSEDIFIDFFRERGREVVGKRKREREKNPDVREKQQSLPPIGTRTGNRTGNLLMHRTTLQMSNAAWATDTV